MLPTIVMVKREADLDEGPPLGPLGFANQMQAGLLGSAVCLERIALDAGANDVLPGGRAATIARDHMVQIKIFSLESFTAILAQVFVPFENIMPGKLHLFLRKMIIDHEQNHARDPDAEGNRVNGFGMRFLLREIVPFAETVGLERAVIAIVNHLRMALENEGQRATRRADVHRLPQAV